MWKELVLFILGVASGFPTLWGTFVFDDGEAIVKNKVVTNPKEVAWSEAFYRDFWGVSISHPHSHKSYRPLTTLTYRWDFQVFGLNPFVFHLENLILHGLNCVLVYHFILKCLRTGDKKYSTAVVKKVAFLSSLLFSVHPVHVEPLGGVVGRADLLGALVFLAGWILCPDPEHRSLVAALWIGFASVAGALFKETAISLCVFHLLMNAKLGEMRRFWRRAWLQYSLPMILSSLFIAWRMWFQGGPPVFQAFDNPPAFANDWFTKFASVSYVWSRNGFLLLCPTWLCYDWSGGCIKLVETWQDGRCLATLLFLAICFAACVRGWKNGDRFLMVACAMYGATFLPSMNILVTVGFVIAERNLYLPSVGFCLLAAYALCQRGNANLFLYVLIMFVARSLQRSSEWLDQPKLFLSGAKVCPNNAKVHYNLGTIYNEQGDYVRAEQVYKRAIELLPEYYQAMNNLGNLLRDRNSIESEFWLRKAISHKNDFAAAWMNLGIVVAKRNHTEALACYHNALKFRKAYPDCLYNLGNLYREMGQTDAALEAWRNATAIKPSHLQSWINSIILLESEGWLMDAKDIGLKAVTILPDSDTLHYLLGNVLGRLQDYASAETNFLRAVELCKRSNRPVPAKYFANLGVLYHRWDKKELAANAYHAALRIDSASPSVRKNLKLLES